MKFWKNNRLDAEFDLPIEQVATLFAESEWAALPWLLDRSLRAFLTDQAGPVCAVWDDEEAFNALLDLVLTRRRTARTTGKEHRS